MKDEKILKEEYDKLSDKDKVWYKLIHGGEIFKTLEDELAEMMAEEIKQEIDKELLETLKGWA